jgi:general secretion pathway protein C
MLGGALVVLMAPDFLQRWLQAQKPKVDAAVIRPETARLPSAPTSIVPGTDVANAKEPLPLLVTSTFPGRNAREGAASIGTRADTAVTISAGGTLANGARLVEVHADRVVLEMGGDRATLYVNSSQPPNLIAGRDRANRRVDASALIHVGGGARPKEVKALPPSEAGRIVIVQPEYAKGQFRGIRLDPGERTAAFQSMGLKAGDILIAVDGLTVTSPASGEDFLGALDAGASVSVAIEREGALVYLTIDLAKSVSPPMPVRDAPVPMDSPAMQQSPAPDHSAQP